VQAVSLSGYDEDSYEEESMSCMKPSATYQEKKSQFGVNTEGLENNYVGSTVKTNPSQFDTMDALTQG